MITLFFDYFYLRHNARDPTVSIFITIIQIRMITLKCLLIWCILQYLLDENTQLSMGQRAYTRQLFLQQHQIPMVNQPLSRQQHPKIEMHIVIGRTLEKKTDQELSRNTDIITWYFSVFSVILPNPDFETLCPYKNCCSAEAFSHILYCAYGAKKSRAVTCSLNFLVFVNFPKHVPREIKFSLATFPAYKDK